MASKRYFDVDSEVAHEASAPSSSKSNTDSKKAGRDPIPQTTLFVSSLPFTATSTDLSTLFSDIGPLKRAFVVTDKESGKSKGVGYVTFAILEDAERAEREMQGKSLDGKRKMRLEWAEKKAFGGRKKVKPEDGGVEEGDVIMHEDMETPVMTSRMVRPIPASKVVRRPVEERDGNAVRTIVITGLAACEPAADDKTIYKRVRKIGDVESVIYPAPLSIVSTQLSQDVAQVIYRTPNHAMTAVEKLHAHTFKGAQISVVVKKRADGAAKLNAHMRPETKEKREKVQQKIEQEKEKIRVASKATKVNDVKGVDVNRGSRLIIRNLPFDVTDRDLRAVFLPYGPIYSIDVPQKIKSGETPKDITQPGSDSKDEEDDEGEQSSGSEGVEESELESESEEDEDEDEDEVEGNSESGDDEDMSSASSPASSQIVAKADDSKMKPAASAGTGRGFAFVWMVSRSDASNAIKGVNGSTIGRGIAEKVQLKAAKGKAGREAGKKALEATLSSAQTGRIVAVDWALSKKEWELKKDESEAEETDKEADDDDDKEKADSDSDLDPEEIKGKDDKEEDEEAKPSLPSPSEQTTLFIRNLPYQATEVELRDVFRAFGPLRYAKVTMDKATNRAKGTGFVCFWQKESADNALRQAQMMEKEVGGTAVLPSAAGQKNPFSAPSVLTADPSAPLTSSLNLHGRVLSVTLAVERNTAESLSNVNKNAREKKDKRNTYLMREGVPLPGTPFAASMSEKEKEKRLANFSIRKTQLLKNPSLFMSKTRLSVRQLPLFVSNKILKRLGIYAAREFDNQVKRGERPDISEEEKVESKELMDEMQLVRDGKEEMSNKKFKKFVGERSTAVIQSKVMLQNDRIDSLTGLGRSRGYGFLEMRSFADALKVVRFINGDHGLSKNLMTWYSAELEGVLKALQKEVEVGAESTVQGEDKEERVNRLKRVEKKISQVKAGQLDAEESGRGGSILVEFSIENIVVTKKRKERADYSQAAATKRKRREDDGEVIEPRKPRRDYNEDRQKDRKRARHDQKEEQRDGKRGPRRENWNQKTTTSGRGSGSADKAPSLSSQASAPATAPAPAPPSSKIRPQMGSLIGRKRKEKKSRK
ncbi:hypothetical protein CBS101457_000342 [Exobasidium rhododendri]|nr:hypothetical protein CBS101457_000342 [Exobasidium rhododendri]